MSQRRRLWGCRQAINVSCIISKYESMFHEEFGQIFGWMSPIGTCTTWIHKMTQSWDQILWQKKHNLETRIVRASGKVTSQMIEIMSRHSTVAFRRHPTIPYQFISFSIPWIRNAFFSLSKMSIRMISEFVLIFWADRNCYLSEALWRFEMRSC